ncbi:MAG TPA: hypothetical protein PLQ35_09120 [bacterium]|nr:hypothetical protein [bacterium]HQL62442.1 hypothetical protein [bacterium]
MIPATAPGEISPTPALSSPISSQPPPPVWRDLAGATGTVSAGVQAGAAEGLFANRIYVLFDNGEYSKLDIRGEVRSFLKVAPPSLEVRNVVPGDVQGASFEDTVADNADTEILRTRLDGGDIELKEFKSERKGSGRVSGIDCRLSVLPRLAARRLVGILILETSHPNQRELQIPIAISPKIALEIRPCWELQSRGQPSKRNSLGKGNSVTGSRP